VLVGVVQLERTLRRTRLIVALLLVLPPIAPIHADVPPEPVGQVEALPQPFHAHWLWIADLVLGRMALVDLDDGRFLGMINGGYGPIAPLFPSRRAEIYVPATYYARRTRGERTDTLDIYDAATLRPAGEVILPAKRATNAVALAHAALSDDERFVAVFNWTTGTSLTIIDVQQRTVTAEIALPGCSLVYAAGPRRFLSICGDGSFLSVTLDDRGHEAAKTRSQPFFDPHTDPVTEKAVRAGNEWLFVSFEGRLHPIDVSGAEIRFGDAWSLLTEAQRAATWRIGGLQHLAVHETSGRLFALMHRGGPDTHKDAGEEVWVFDIAARQRLQRVALVNPGVTIYGFPVEFGRTWIAPFNRLSSWLLDTFAPAAVSAIQVTRDAAPLLVTASQFSGSVGIYDALSGKFLRRVQPVGWTSDILLAPWDGQAAP
jgi:methylamine dehydrogenase heavy chain